MKDYIWAKKALICTITLLSIYGLGANTAGAKHVHHYQYRSFLTYHHHIKHIKNRHYRHERHLAIKEAHKHRQREYRRVSNQGSDLTNHIRKWLIHDINKSRRRHHRKPLRASIWLQKAADYRAPYVQYAYENYDKNGSLSYYQVKMWVHGYDMHASLEDYLRAHRTRIATPKFDGENVCDYIVGGTQYQQDNTIAPYNNNSAHGVAANVNDDLMNHDMAQGNDNGHRRNELSPRYKYLGVGIRYNPDLNYGTVTEDYAD